MKVLLVNPPSETEKATPLPLGLLYLAAYLEHEHEVKIVDMKADNISRERLGEIVAEFDPDFFGIRCLTYLTPTVYSLCQYIKSIRPSCMITVGGPHTQANPKEIIEKPFIDNVVIGEGGSGGALAVGVGDEILMLENSFYSVISPEGCAAILWKDQQAVNQAAENLKFLAKDLMDLGIIDKIIPEPPGGAHIDWEQTFKNVDKQLQASLKQQEGLSVEIRLEARYQKFRRMGIYTEK